MGSRNTVGMSSTFLSNLRERASNFSTCILLVSSPRAISTEDMRDTQDHTTGNSSGDLWEVHTLAGVQCCAGPVLQAQALGELKDALANCTSNRDSPNGTEVPAFPSKWMADGSQGLRELSVDVQPVQT